jgi:hypothetical protein
MTKSAIVLYLLLGVIITTSCYAQKKEKPESKRYDAYKSSNADQASSLLKEAAALKADNPGEALNKVEEALGISIAQKDGYNEGKCYLLIGEINEGIQEWKLANNNFNIAYQKLKDYNNPKSDLLSTPEFAAILRGLGNTHLKLNQYAQALRYYEEMLKLKRHVNHDRVLLDIAEVHYQQGNYDEAQKTIDNIPRRKVADSQVTSGIQNLEARILASRNELKNLPQANYEANSSAAGEGQVAPNQAQVIQESKEELSQSLRGQQRYAEDIDLRNKSIQYNSKINNLEEVAKDKVAISKSLADLGETGAALNELKDAAKIADTLDNPEAKAQAYLALANFYERDGSEKLAIQAYRKYSEAVGSSAEKNILETEQREEILKKQQEIEALSKEVSISQEQEKFDQATVVKQKMIIYGLIFIILIVATASYFSYKNAVASKIANQLLALKSLRSQMNPHFIFNALNSVNHFIAQQDERTANKFLSEFSQLMRLVLENSQEDFIPLNKEQEILALYLKLEHYRFRDKFDYTIDIDEGINTELIQVPPMLIQPYIENAVWHGLRYKESKGTLVLRIKQQPDNLVVEIQDDGIGRKKSAELKTANQKKHNSTGLRNIQERLKILNRVYKAKYSVQIDDLPEGKGTVVRVFLPVHNFKNA